MGKKQLQDININLGEVEYNCYAIKYEQLKKYEKHYDVDGTINSKIQKEIGRKKMIAIILVLDRKLME